MVLFFLISWRLRKKSVKSLILQAHGRQPPILAVSLFLKILVRCPTVLQADVSLPLDVRSKVEVERDVDLVSAIYVYPADELVDDHLLRFKICTVVQVSISWCALAANLIGIIELLAVYFFVFAGKFSIDPTDTSITSRVAPALTMILIVLLVLTAIMSVASVIVSYAVHEDEEAFVDDWNSNDPSRDAETNLVDDGNATTVPATDNSMTVVASLIQMNTNRSFAIYNNTEVVIGKGSQANIIVSNPIISRAHAKISCRNGVCTIQDLGSKNGTFVGDEKILGSNTVTLANGMYITLGNEIFQFKI